MLKRAFTYIFLLICLAAFTYGQTNEPFFLLVNTERDFLWTVQEEGLRAGYLGFLHKESIVFTEDGVHQARKYYRSADSDSAALLRIPERVDITDDGLLGYTLGSFEYREDVKSGHTDQTGHYLTFWKRKDSRDDWKIILDIAVRHPPGDRGEGIPPVDLYKKQIADIIPITAALEVAKSKQILMDSDDLLNVSLQAGRYAFAHEEFYEDNAIMLREDTAPAIGGASTVKRMESMQGRYSYESGDGFLTPTRSFAYTFGTAFYYENIDTVRWSQWYHYVRVWKKNRSGLWRIIIDVEKPFEKSSK